MAGLLVYIPGQPAVSLADLEGLDVVHSTAFEFVPVGAGPDGQSGVVCTFKPECQDGVRPRTAYKPQEQAWKKCAKGSFWLGYEKANPPTPQDLERRNIIKGYEATMPSLFGTHEWMCPTAKVLPSYLGLDDEGEYEWIIFPEYLDVSKMADRVFREHEGEDDDLEAVVPEQEKFEIAMKCLSLNYRVGWWELTVLGLMTTENQARILFALMDGPSLGRKKKGS